MKTIAWGILVAVLAWGSGCAHPDWIEQTLVTVDVTGTWVGSVVHASGNSLYELTLEQQGPKVKGSVRRDGSLPHTGTTFGSGSGPIEGAVAGDVFSFRQTNGPLKGETTVSGDEMTGEVSVNITYRITLRRVNSSSRPSLQGR